MQLQVERIFRLNPNPYTLEPASFLAHTLGGDRNLPLGGAALAYCWVGLHLYGAQGSASTVVNLIDKRSTVSDESFSEDSAPGGIIGLANTVALGPETSMLSVFVDVRCFAGVEESDQFRSGFAIFECRDKGITETSGLYVPPSRLHLQQVTASLCQLPVLLRNGAAIESV